MGVFEVQKSKLKLPLVHGGICLPGEGISVLAIEGNGQRKG